MRHIAIVGAGGFGREVLAVLEEQVARTAELHGTRICFVDDAKAGQTINGVEVLSAATYAEGGADRQFVIAISSSEAREREAARLLALRLCRHRGRRRSNRLLVAQVVDLPHSEGLAELVDAGSSGVLRTAAALKQKQNRER